MKLIIVILFGFLWDNINCFGTYNDNAFIPKTFCSTKRRKAVVKMNTNEKISRKGVVIVLEIQLILSLFLLSINKDFILELHKLVLI